MGIASATVEDAAEVVVAALAPGVHADWSVRAGSLEWDVDATVAHMTGALVKYTLYLALLWVNGRRHGATASWEPAPPLDERDRTPLEFAFDEVRGAWRPVWL